MFHAKFWSASVLVSAFWLAACAGGVAAPATVRKIVSTTSFGMCVGYCTTRLEISEGEAVLVREARGGRGASDLPEQRFSATLSEGEWQEITHLAANTNLGGLPPVLGCPDCADGGAESLMIVVTEGSRSVTFEHGADIKQAQPLLDRVRALRARMMPE